MKTIALVIKVVKEVGEEQGIQALLEPNENTHLFGVHLDSMGVVFLITDLETAVSDEYDIDIILADERAMSQKTSPFRTIKSLANYIEILIEEEKGK